MQRWPLTLHILIDNQFPISLHNYYVLSAFKLNPGKKLTCYPALAVRLDGNYNYSTDQVVVDGNMVSVKAGEVVFGSR